VVETELRNTQVKIINSTYKRWKMCIRETRSLAVACLLTMEGRDLEWSIIMEFEHMDTMRLQG